MANVVFYRCEVCGNMVAMLKHGGGTLSCCDQPMNELVANTSDGAKEKHVPDLKFEDGRIKVTIGSVLHPSLPEHHIEWIALVSGDKVQFSFLKPGMDPVADFEEVEHGEVYEYCNLHGLWNTEF